MADLAENINPVLSGPVRSAERFFHADVMTYAVEHRLPFAAQSRRGADAVEVLPAAGQSWLRLGSDQLREAINRLSTAFPDRTIQCDHGLRINVLVATLGKNQEGHYDSCLISGVLEMAVLGAVEVTHPDEDDLPVDADAVA